MVGGDGGVGFEGEAEGEGCGEPAPDAVLAIEAIRRVGLDAVSTGIDGWISRTGGRV